MEYCRASFLWAENRRVVHQDAAYADFIKRREKAGINGTQKAASHKLAAAERSPTW